MVGDQLPQRLAILPGVQDPFQYEVVACARAACATVVMNAGATVGVASLPCSRKTTLRK
jgi:hypothetical protein